MNFCLSSLQLLPSLVSHEDGNRLIKSCNEDPGPGVTCRRMGLPQLDTCCMVADLKTGNLIIGALNALLSFIMTVTMIVVAVGASAISDLAQKEQLVDPEQQAALTGVYALTVILVFMFLAKFCFDAFFIYGVAVERPGIIKAYFIMWSVFFILSVITFFVNTPQYNAATIFTFTVYILFNVYVILLSNSFYRQINCRESV